jgi:hypothetical protein
VSTRALAELASHRCLGCLDDRCRTIRRRDLGRITLASASVWRPVARVEENALVRRPDDEPRARLQLPVPYDVGRNGHAERATLTPDADGEASNESPAFRTSDQRERSERWERLRCWQRCRQVERLGRRAQVRRLGRRRRGERRGRWRRVLRRGRWGRKHGRIIARDMLGGLIVAMRAKSDFVRLKRKGRSKTPTEWEAEVGASRPPPSAERKWCFKTSEPGQARTAGTAARDPYPKLDRPIAAKDVRPA